MTIDEFQKVELRIATVLAAERVEGSEKLVKLQISLGEAERQVVAGIGKTYTPEELAGKQIVIVANLDPRTFTLRRGLGQEIIESQGMLLAAPDESGAPVLLMPEHEVQSGAAVR